MSNFNENKMPLVFILLSVIFIILNYISINKLEPIYGAKEKLKKDDEAIHNTKYMDSKDFKNFSYTELLNLAQTYYAKNDLDKSKEIALIILSRNPNDRDTLNLLSAIAIMQLDFETSIKYNEKLIPDSQGTDLFYLYINLGELYLTKDINKSIDYFKKAETLINNEQAVAENLGNYEITGVSNKLKFFTNLKSLTNNDNPIELYKAIINDDEFINLIEIKQYFYNKYKNQYSSKFPNDFKELKEIYEDKVIPFL